MLHRMQAFRRTVLLLAVFMASIGAGPAAIADEDGAALPAGTASVKGKFLVAHPSLPDPRFAHAVILMIRHDATGAFGLIVNRPLGVAELTPEELGATAKDATHRAPIHFLAALGGPVERSKGFIIHSEEYATEDTIRVAPHVAVSASPRILQDIADGKGPKRTLYVVGYAGWGPGQLESEMRQESWYEAPVDEGLIFDGADADAVWEQAVEMRLRGI